MTINELANKLSAVGPQNTFMENIGNLDGMVTLSIMKDGQRQVLAENIPADVYREAMKLAQNRVILG